MIDVFDLMNRSRTHLPFNAAFLRIVAAAYPDRDVRFAAHPSHIEAIRELGPFPAQVSLIALPEAAFIVAASHGEGIRNVGATRHLRDAALAPNVVIMGACAWSLDELRRDRALQAGSHFDIIFHATLAVAQSVSAAARSFRYSGPKILAAYPFYPARACH